MLRLSLILVFAALQISACGESPQKVFTPANATSKDWLNGVARNWATGVLIDKGAAQEKDFSPGKVVTFADGTARSVVRTQVFGADLIVYLEGSPLDGELIGYPKQMKLSSP